MSRAHLAVFCRFDKFFFVLFEGLMPLRVRHQAPVSAMMFAMVFRQPTCCQGLLNVNEATVEELMSLPGIGRRW